MAWMSGRWIFDHDRPAVLERRAMHLRQRGRPERLVVDRAEELVRRLAELLRDQGLGHRPRERRHGALELGELLAPPRRQELLAAAHHLAELHVGRAELLEHHPDLGCRRQLVQARGRRSAQPVDEPAESRQRGAADRDLLRVAGDDRVHLVHADVLDDLVPARDREPVET